MTFSDLRLPYLDILYISAVDRALAGRKASLPRVRSDVILSTEQHMVASYDAVSCLAASLSRRTCAAVLHSAPTA